MRAARFDGRGDIRVDGVPEPVTGPGQVMIDVEWCGICGDHAETIALLADGKIDSQQLITARISLDDLVAGGFRELIDHQEAHVKILVHP